jgi:L-methionine (R)-S-oxide reductase
MTNLEKKYLRIIEQLNPLFQQTKNPLSRMASVCALLHHKMEHYFWTGYYLLDENNDLLVSTYQGPIACLKLQKDKGVCWASINQQKSLFVPDVELFPGHIACNSLSKSEIVIPLVKDTKIVGVFDIDSDRIAAFKEFEIQYLEQINAMIYS